jgi:hypothetical protein
MRCMACPNRNSPPATLPRELSGWRKDQEAHHRQPVGLAERTRQRAAHTAQGRHRHAATSRSIIVRRALPHGHVAAVLGTPRGVGLDRILGPAGNCPAISSFDKPLPDGQIAGCHR